MTPSWRLLLTGPGEPGFNMALDEAVAIAVRRGWSRPTLRVYRWQRPTISMGCHQPVEVLRAFEEPRGGIAIVRRPTAGGAVRHDQDVSYALACDQQVLRGHPSRSLYRRFHEALRTAMEGRGRTTYALSASSARAVPEDSLCFARPVADDLMRGSVKVAGAAQRRWRDGLLQQGTVAEPELSADRVALCIRTAWAAVFACRFMVESLSLQERMLADELWSKYRPWTPSSWPPVSPGVSNPSR